MDTLANRDGDTNSYVYTHESYPTIAPCLISLTFELRRGKSHFNSSAR